MLQHLEYQLESNQFSLHRDQLKLGDLLIKCPSHEVSNSMDLHLDLEKGELKNQALHL